MTIFEDIQDVEDWLAPCDYGAFWKAVAPWEIFSGDDRAHYDQVVAAGGVDPESLLFCLKNMARVEMQIRFGLNDRLYEPPEAQYLRRIH